MRFFKYHALGNDYLVLDPQDASFLPAEADIIRICHRNFGLGSDGILFGPLPSSRAEFGLRILNPDGSEAEKSGNGLRIFARYLFDTGRVGADPFQIETPGGVVQCVVAEAGQRITVAMGAVSFTKSAVPINLPGPEREILQESIEVGGETVVFSAATVGNPHCVVLAPEADETLARRLGPLLEVHPAFPRRTNVQFVHVVDRSTLRLEIWERGAGYTLASGSSSSAAAAVAHRLGLVDRDLTVIMPGGRLGIQIGDGFQITMTGPATRVATMELDPEALG